MSNEPQSSEGTQTKENEAASAASVTQPAAAERETDGESEGERVSAEVVDIEAELESDSARPHAPPLPRSMRPNTAKDVAGRALGVTATLPAPVWPPKTIADLMVRKIFTVREDEPIGKLEQLMQKFRFAHLPVVGAQMKLVGLITRTDLLHAQLGIMPEGAAPTKIEPTTLASALMRRNVVFAKLDTSITTTGQVMLANNLPCIPVVLDDMTLVGIVTEADFVRLALEFLSMKIQLVR
jgi:CBS domain-containing protein